MKRTLVWCAVAMMSLLVAAQTKDTKMGGEIEQAIAGLEQQWIDAAKTSNPEPLAPLLAGNFVNTGSDGKVIGKAETLAHIKAAKWETQTRSAMGTRFPSVGHQCGASGSARPKTPWR